MEAIILCGIQATGKSTFCKERFSDTHMRLNLDMLKTRHREDILLRACIDSKQPFVVDNTNPSSVDRARYISLAKAAAFKVTGYYFESKISDSLTRNTARPEPQRVSDTGVKATASRLEIPRRDEGFDNLYYVRITPKGFEVLEWRDEV